jgi:hypothetical protein
MIASEDLPTWPRARSLRGDRRSGTEATNSGFTRPRVCDSDAFLISTLHNLNPLRSQLRTGAKPERHDGFRRCW